MIVDDKIVICGSANINDRSMNGERDSEIAAVIKDYKNVPIKMNGLPFMAKKFAHDLRVELMAEHIGMDLSIAKTELSDPISSVVYVDLWQKTANHNKTCFETIIQVTQTAIQESVKYITKEKTTTTKKRSESVDSRYANKEESIEESEKRSRKEHRLTIPCGKLPTPTAMNALKDVRGHLVPYPLTKEFSVSHTVEHRFVPEEVFL
eukprot:TRINITY_DN6993_c0_g1_i1.p1 TRINITY_DN6993_c0_g1~~TRINITY_DN6993_c0_g1_i1.p1  ORF type:complete len:238 (-),score=28.44 TRINITY_DN6993_c0_g1_i1:40-660(-)